ncbi:MAG TPA: tetratricopeptide repeat protein [Pyrinomonadaceae bacterium]|nr:tetratricopeptide repeat protein [Pyrinomonadaceae bacterium]
MIEPETSTAGTLAQRTQIAASPDWQNLLTYFDVSGEGFAFIVLLVPDGDWAKACRQALERYLIAYRKRLVTLRFESAEEFEQELASRLLSLQVDEETGAVWVGAAIPEVSKEYEKWQAAWRVAVARLNQYRNPLRQQFNVPLLFVGSPWIQTTLREMAPDLWSVRTLVVRITPSSADSERMDQSSSSQEYVGTWEEGRTIDPDFALKQAENVRGQPGKELPLSRLLSRAGLGFIARYRWDEAERALTEAINLHRQFGEAAEELANLLYNYADVLQGRNAYDQAVSVLLEALTLYQQSKDVLGEANCLFYLGHIALKRSQFEEARTRYEEAVRLYRQIGAALGEANCLHGLGHLAYIHSLYDEARTRYEEALQLYPQIGNVLGEANCLYSLGEIALTRSELDEARTRFEEALRLYRQIGDMLGEANCLYSLGEIALKYSRYDEAQTYSEEALQLYRETGDILGEANCIYGLGDIALAKKEEADAKRLYTTALELYEQIPQPHSIGRTHLQLARLIIDEKEREQHLQAARAALESIGLTDLVKRLDEEFSKVAN